MSTKKLTLAGIGCGSRTRTYLKLASAQPEKYQITAVADPVAVRMEQVKNNAPEQDRESIKFFANADELLKQPRLADIAVIGTQDDYHFEPCMRALELGYDVLLEKPIAKTLREALLLRNKATELGRRVAVCHVLRYTPFYRTIRQIIESGELGEIISYNANEGVEPFHFSHSFVRGHWGNMGRSTPMIVAKCCHDMDIMHWLMGKKCLSMASFGELSFFRKETLEKQGISRPERCTDWTSESGSEDDYDARKYITDPALRRWLGMVYDGGPDATDEQIFEWLQNNPWGRDAFQCDNDQPDHQVCILRYEGGLTGTFTMTAFEVGRHIEIYGTKARLRAGHFYKQHNCGEIVVTPHFGGESRQVVVEEPQDGYAGHGGGDWGMMTALHDDMQAEDYTLMTTSIQDSAHSHVMAFAAEHARRTGQVIDIAEFERAVLAGELEY